MSVLVLRVSCLTLFNLQGARLRTQSPASAQLLYHSFQSLSRTFFFFFQVLVSALPLSGPPFVTALIEYHSIPRLSSTFLKKFVFCLKKWRSALFLKTCPTLPAVDAQSPLPSGHPELHATGRAFEYLILAPLLLPYLPALPRNAETSETR